MMSKRGRNLNMVDVMGLGMLQPEERMSSALSETGQRLSAQ